MSVLWNPDGAVLVTTAHRSTGGLYLEDGDASVKLWSARTGKLLRTIKGKYEAAYSENNALFVTASYDTVEIYDAHTMKKTTRGGGAYMFASPSPDGMLRASRVSDGASVWIQPVTAGGKCTAPGLFAAFLAGAK